MGEMADFILQDMMDYETLWGPEYEPEDQSFLGGKTCRCCGAKYLVWGKWKGDQWRLFESHNDGTAAKIHRCPVNPLKEQPDDE